MDRCCCVDHSDDCNRVSARLEKGSNVFKQCQPCHAIGPGAQNKIGPELNGLDGRKAGTVANFNYSEANKNSGVVWNEQTFKVEGENSRYKNDFRRS